MSKREEDGYWVVQNRWSGERISTHSTRLEALCTAFDIVHMPNATVCFGDYGDREDITSSSDGHNVRIQFINAGDSDE